MVLRVDYFENYAGRYLSVEAKDRLGGARPTGAPTSARRCRSPGTTGAGTPIDSPPRADEREHRPGHDARHVHRASPAGPDRRRRQLGPAPADAHPGRLEHRRDRGGGRELLARRRPAAYGTGLPQGLHDPLHGPDRGLRALRRARGPSSRTSPGSCGCRTGPTATSAGRRPRWPARCRRQAHRRPRAQGHAVVLTSRAWGHEGGNDLTAEFRNPAVPRTRL